MPILKKTAMIFTILSITTLLWIGCSDNSIINFVDNNGATEQTEAIEQYFPLTEGYTTIFNITYISGGFEQVTFRAGKTVSFQGINAVEWTGSSQNSLDIGYFYPSNNTLYYYSSISATPEKILELPFTYGKTWATNDINSNDFSDIITGTDDTTGYPDINAKTFPTVSAANFTVEATEALVLGTGNSYSQSVRISAPNGTRKNYYWYAPGVGLVKYVIGASAASYPNGDVVGEIVNYGF